MSTHILVFKAAVAPALPPLSKAKPGTDFRLKVESNRVGFISLVSWEMNLSNRITNASIMSSSIGIRGIVPLARGGNQAFCLRRISCAQRLNRTI